MASIAAASVAAERLALRGPVALVPLGAPAAVESVATGRALAATRAAIEASGWETAGPTGPVAVVAARRAGVPETTGAPTTRAEALSVNDLAARASSQRIVLIEGDSWYHFPVPFAVGLDWALRDHHRYNIDLHFARAGGTLKGMVYGNRKRDLRDVLGALDRVRPRMMLFSGGGNDVVGPEFASYLNHRDSGRPALREAFMEMQHNEVFLPAYRHLITRVREASPETKIFVHGYAHAFPSGRAVDIAFLDELGIIRIGPWMKPSLEDNGWDAATGRRVVVRLIDRFNEMLAALQTEFAGTFFHVDLRPVVKRERDWRDELHLDNGAWRKCADKIHQAIRAAIPGW